MLISRLSAVLFGLLLLFASLSVKAFDPPLQPGSTPLRLSYSEGDVSFWREGAQDWVQARLNTPMAAGDALYIGRDGDLELQLWSRSFIRADDETQLTLVSQAADYIQFKVTSGRVSFDLRSLPVGYSIEIDTPHAAFTIDRSGYYRLDVNGDVHFITRRGGRAMVVPAGGQAMSIHPSEEIVVDEAGDIARAEAYAAPPPDRWDRWNFERSDDLIDSVSERYLPAGVAGANDLDHYGRWRIVDEYGPVWVPDDIVPGWAPYSTGRWVWDPYYQWTWIDDAPWGWAPFHYGRWVHLRGTWAWAPGPAARVSVYSPALVAFFGLGSNLSIGIGTSGLGWVALSWGEPLTPWWGAPGFVGRPWWGGWHGPRVVNNVVINQNVVINTQHITYQNTRVNHAVVATTREHFGRRHVQEAPMRIAPSREFKHIGGILPVKPVPASLVAGAPSALRPPERMLSRPVVATRPAPETSLPWRKETPGLKKPAPPEARYVTPAPVAPENPLRRPEFGTRGETERPRQPMPPRYEEMRREPQMPAARARNWERNDNGRSEAPPSPRSAPPEAATLPDRRMGEPAPTRATPIREKEMGQTPPQFHRSEPAPVLQPAPRPVPQPAPEPLMRQERSERRELPGQPANRMFHGQERVSREPQRAPQSPERPGRHFGAPEARPQ